jgi:thiosulfate/3-mercaptopyruvate sulfurtransferase
MYKSLALLGAITAALLTPLIAAADAVPAVVDAAWLKANADEVVVVDLQEPKAFARLHIPGATNLPYATWRTRAPEKNKDASALESMLPPVERLEVMLGEAGVGNDDHVVIAAAGRGAGDLAASARVFWTLKVLGHDKVSVLDGGILAFASAGGRVGRGTAQRAATTYAATPNMDLVPDADAVQALRDAGVQTVDARSEGEFVGIYTGDEDERPGTIPGAKHLPYDWVAADGVGRFRSTGALRQLFAARGIDPDAEQVHFCHSGNRAALTWFAAYAMLGNENVKLYDGSMMEWAQTETRPVAAEIELCEDC